MFYLVKSPWILQKLYPECLWNIKTSDKILYLTFDDGPHPVITPYVLDLVKQYNAKVTFFCIGNNVTKYSSVFQTILSDGHSVGNHTYDHFNGWKISDSLYLQNILNAKDVIPGNLFRPPYGRITKFQIKQLSTQKYNLQTVMWSVLSGDFDEKLSSENCLLNVIRNAKAGSIVVFHDSEKAFEKLKYALPRVLDFFSERGYTFSSIPPQISINGPE